jgi:hypothetical protein
MAIPKNFWIPPASGYTPANRGLTQDQLAAIEVLNGFSFPSAYRSLMLQQNGLTLVLAIRKPWFPIDRAIDRLCLQLSTLENISDVKMLP